MLVKPSEAFSVGYNSGVGSFQNGIQLSSSPHSQSALHVVRSVVLIGAIYLAMRDLFQGWQSGLAVRG
jgi:hypothetical protein